MILQQADQTDHGCHLHLRKIETMTKIWDRGIDNMVTMMVVQFG
jgi:hypothetical protein